jgi:hypothetical protein
MVRIPFFHDGALGPKMESSSTRAPGALSEMVFTRVAFIVLS